MIDIEIVCETCNKTFIYNRKNRKGNTRKNCNSCVVSKKRKQLKEKAIDYKGGCCSICGYNRCNRALDFHHLDPSIKSFNVGWKGYTRSWDKLKEELDKTILVCSNCHREIEDEIINNGA